MEIPKISVIVPVYNVEKYLSICIESVLNQSFKNFELILINDGSSDKSGIICDKYSLKDKRISVVHKENEGVSAARNYGLKICRGEYVIFIDSDDFIDSDTLEVSYNMAKHNNIDTVIFGIESFDDSDRKELITYNQLKDTKIYSSKDAIKKFLNYEIRGYSCNRLVKRTVLIENNILYPEGIRFGEDICPTLKIISNSNKVMLFNKPMYHYRQSNSSASKKLSEKDLKDYISQVDESIKFYESLNYDIDMLDYIKTFKIFTYLNAVNWYIKLLEFNMKDIKYRYNEFFSNIHINYNVRDVFLTKQLNKNYKIIFLLWRLNLYSLFIKLNII